MAGKFLKERRIGVGHSSIADFCFPSRTSSIEFGRDLFRIRVPTGK